VTVGRVVTAGDGGSLHVGGRVRPAKPHGLMLHAPKYGLDLRQWPTTPASTSYGQAPAVQAVLDDALGNDHMGVCTIADGFKRQALRQSSAGSPVYHPPIEQVIATYARDSGYTGDPSTDRGCDEVVVLSHARDIGIVCSDSGVVDRIVGYMVVDPANRDLVRACASMFVGAAICAELPEQWLYSAAPGATWDVPAGGYKPAPENGHCYTLLDQDEQGLTITTWGRRMRQTYDALAACASSSNGGGLYVALDAQILNAAAQAAPDGLDWEALIADFNALPSAVMEPPGP
jgi:hypothetical protein